MEKTANRSRTKKSSNKNMNLTSHETLLIWRKRLGWNQTQAAKECRCSIFQYKLAEYGKPIEGFTYPLKTLHLEPHEKCLIYRKRAKLKQSEVADKLGICRNWMRQQESGKIDAARLLSWWEAGG